MGEQETRRARLPGLEEWIAALLPWGWPERLAFVGLGGLLAGVVLPWGQDADGVSRQLVEHEQAGWLGVCLVVLAVAVPAHTTVSGWTKAASVAIGVAAALAPPLTLLVTEDAGDTLPLLAPGRVAIVAGCVCLLVAVLARTRAKVAPRRPVAAPSDSNGPSVEARFERAATDIARASGGSALGGAALAMIAAGAATVIGPWWFGPAPEPVPGAVRAFRSGFDELGGVRSAAVAVAVLLAGAVVVRLGGRRGAPVVAAAGAVVAGVLLSGAVDISSGRTVVPLVGVVSAGAGLVAAIIVLWSGLRSRSWLPSSAPPPADLAELAAAVERRAQWDADRWIVVAGMGLGAIAVSTQLYWRVGAIPIGPLSSTAGSIVLCVGLAVGAVAIAAARFWPWTHVTGAAETAMLAAVVLVVVSWFKLTAVDVGSATLLALLGAFITASAAVAPLRRLEALPPAEGGRRRRAKPDPTANRGPYRPINLWGG